MSNLNVILVVLSIVALGWLALLLVSNELGQKVRLNRMGRVALASGLGLGIIALSLKAGVLVYLNGLSSEEMQSWQKFAATSQQRQQSPAKVTAIAPDLASSGNWSTWQALPTIPKMAKSDHWLKAKQDLGRKLFFDKNLSIDRTIACATCHDLGAGGDDNAQFSTGIQGLKGDRNAPTVLNAAFLTRFFWDGRAASLEAQAKQPFINPVEMAMPDLNKVVERVQEDKPYRSVFDAAFGEEANITIGRIAKAIASYERLLVTPSSPYDLFILGDDAAMTAQQLRGMALFQEVGCRQCHIDPTFSSAGSIKPIGTYRTFPVFPDNPYIGKYDLLVDGKSRSWRVPSLRNVARTAPYFHNGSVTDLKEAIRIMAVSQLSKVISNDPADDILVSATSVGGKSDRRRLTILRDQALDDQDIDDLAAFLSALSAEPPQAELTHASNMQ